MLLHACGGFPRRFQAILLGSTGHQGPLQGSAPGPPVLNKKSARRVPPKPRTLGEAEISRGGGGGLRSGQGSGMSARGSRGGF